MKRRQKQESSYVKRIKLKKSILRTHQILNTISIQDQRSINMGSIGSTERLNDYQISQKIRKLSKDMNTILDTQLYKNQGNIVKPNQMKKILHYYQQKSIKNQRDTINIKGLQIRRIVADPNNKRHSAPQNKLLLNRSIPKTKNPPSLAMSFSHEFSLVANYQRYPFTYKSEVCTTNSLNKPSDTAKQTERSEQNFLIPTTPNRRNRVYLYEKMSGTENKARDQTNLVYEKRIKSYTDFLWKCLLAYNVYINLDLRNPQISVKKLKAFVGFGNNCNMIIGLIKRRFWWAISEEMTDDCTFVWTQLKVNKIFERQESARINQTSYIQQFSENRLNVVKTCIPNKRKNTVQVLISKAGKDKQVIQYDYYNKIWNDKDKKVFEKYFEKQLIVDSERQRWQTIKMKQQNYLTKTKQINLKYKQILILDDFSLIQKQDQQLKHNYYQVKPIVHNHLQNNFHLGNKKALFYNLQEFYRKVGQNLFHYVPLTFHIKNGFKDKQYKRFIQFFQKRAKLIKQQQQKEQKLSKKTRNIWIVKPGQNSNQGRGIVVIDQIYQLNNIMKQSSRSNKNIGKQAQQSNQSARTYIVQMYIDRPFLYNQRKFDIRHYMLITNIYGAMRAYWYDEGYIRTSAYCFNIHNFEPQIHLTNDAIQKKYPDYGKYEPFNKISYSQFQNYLNSLTDKKYNFKEEILTQMKKMGVDAAKSIYTKIAPKQQMNNFEIFGLDFMIDRNFRPWLIQINTNPCLESVCPLLDRIIPYMVQQSLKLSLDLVYPPPCHYPNTAKHYAPMINLQNFKYQLIFDSLSEGQSLMRLYHNTTTNILQEIGEIADDEQFIDDGKEIKLEDFT